MFEVGGVPPLVRLLVLQPPQPITEKAAWALSNLTAGSSPSQEEFCALGGLEVVALLLRQFTGVMAHPVRPHHRVATDVIHAVDPAMR